MVTSDHASPVGRWQAHQFIAGHPALELANTIRCRHVEAPEDMIARSQDLADWCASVGLAQVTAKVTAADVPRVHALRDAIYRLFSEIAAGRPYPASPVALLLRAAAQRFEARAKPRLDAELAWQAINALTALPHHRVGECPRCGWLFVDTSKGGRRRWCTMAVCGTREKVRAHRERNGR
jgi:predicted RNA-binding Zn ribbon-like protein